VRGGDCHKQTNARNHCASPHPEAETFGLMNESRGGDTSQLKDVFSSKDETERNNKILALAEARAQEIQKSYGGKSMNTSKDVSTGVDFYGNRATTGVSESETKQVMVAEERQRINNLYQQAKVGKGLSGNALTSWVGEQLQAHDNEVDARFKKMDLTFPQ